MQDDIQHLDVLGGEGTSSRRSSNFSNQRASSLSHNQQFQNQYTQMQDGRCDAFGSGRSSTSISSLPRQIQTTLPSPLHNWIDVGEKMTNCTIRDHTSKMYQE